MYQNLAGGLVGLLGTCLAASSVITSRVVKPAAPGHGQVAIITLSYGCVAGARTVVCRYASPHGEDSLRLNCNCAPRHQQSRKL
jgi:hypothetical protein